MRVSDILADQTPSLSFEVFPPKKDSAFESVREATERVAAAKPAFMSVTYGAGGGTSRYTVDIASNIIESTGVDTIAHLTCVSTSREDIDRQLERMKDQGIENVMALRGDIPEGAEDRDKWSFQYASDLVRHIKSRGDFCIGGACYPECHPESVNSAEDIKHLKEKVDAGVDFLTTQMFFDNSVLYNFLYKIREAGITVPVVPGIMPVTKASQLGRIGMLSGSFLPRRFNMLVDRFGSDPAAMKQAGIAYATDQVIDLFANGINHVHIYTMNDGEVCEKLMENLSEIIK